MRARIVMALAFALNAAAGEPSEYVFPDSLSVGLTVNNRIEESPPYLQVHWIKWDSGFRGSGLQVGDRILAIDGKKLELPKEMRELQKMMGATIGSSGESSAWSQKGAKEGTPVKLTVQRRAAEGMQTLEVTGTLRSARRFKNADGAETLGAGGPPSSRSLKEYSVPWGTWYEKFVDRSSRALDGGWQSASFSSRYEYDSTMQDKGRVEDFVAHHPGPFANALKEDWERVRAYTAGAVYSLTEKDLEFRKAVDLRIQQTAAAAQKERDAFFQKITDKIEPFPAIDPVTGDKKKVVGKALILPKLTNKNFLMVAGKCYMAAGERKTGYYFIDCLSPGAQRMLSAAERYKRLVTPTLATTYEMVARISDKAHMIVVPDGKPVGGMLLDIIGATVGDKMFVDTSVEKEKGVSRFAGEEQLLKQPAKPLADSATPRQVMEAFIAAAKDGNEDTWRSFFAPWKASKDRWGSSYLDNYKRRAGREWIDSRALLMDRVNDVRIAWMSPVEQIMTGKEFKGAPVIDQVLIEVNHIGKFDGEYRTFGTVAVHRQWVLQRKDGGPWRIASFQGI
jgi:hypothetical protein